MSELAVRTCLLDYRLRDLFVFDCSVTPALAPDLTWALDNARLIGLKITGDFGGARLLAADSVTPLCAALAGSSLRDLDLKRLNLFQAPELGIKLLGALKGHPTLKELSLADNPVPEAARASVGAAFAALLTTESPLINLIVDFCALGDAGMRPLLEALRVTPKLKCFDCCGSRVSGAFARNVFLPAIRANTSLRRLRRRTKDMTSCPCRS